MQRLRTVLALVPLLATTLPAAAVQVAPMDILEAAAAESDEFVAWRVFVPAGGVLGYEAFARPQAGGQYAWLALWILDASTGEVSRETWGGFFPRSPSLQVEAGPLGMLVEEDGPDATYQGGGGGSNFHTSGSRAPAVDSEYVIVWLAFGVSPVPENTMNLTGTEDVRILGRTAGPTFHHDSTEFRGGVGAQLAGLPPVGYSSVGARVLQGLSFERRIEHRMFAFYVSISSLGVQRVGWDGPGGLGEDSECLMPPLRCGDSMTVLGPAGDYTFRIDHLLDAFRPLPVCVVLGPCVADSWSLVFGADVPLP